MRIAVEISGRPAAQVRVHVVRHHLQPAQIRLLIPDQAVEVLAPPVRVGGDRDTALPTHLAAQVAPRHAAPQVRQVRYPVTQQVPAEAGDLDPGEDHEARRGRPQFLQLIRGPEAVVLGDYDPVQLNLFRPADQLERVDLAVRRIPAGVHVQVERHHDGLLPSSSAVGGAAMSWRSWAASRFASCRARTRSAPAWPIRVRSSAGVRSNRRTASAVASTFPAGTSHPFSPDSTSSGTPAMYVPTTGRPIAIASIMATGKFSAKLGMTRPRAVRRCSRTWALLCQPANSTRSVSPSRLTSASSAGRSGPSPANTIRNSAPASRTLASAWIKSRWPFCSTRPATSTSLSVSGTGSGWVLRYASSTPHRTTWTFGQ